MTSQWTFDLGEGPSVEAAFDARTRTAEFIGLDAQLHGAVRQRTGTFEEIVEQCNELTKFAVVKGWLNSGQASHRRTLINRWYQREVEYAQRRYGR